MISSLLLEAAIRSILLALAVWIGLRIFGVRNVLAQKAAWGLVLAGAVAMPLVLPVAARVPAALVIPAEAMRVLAGFRPAMPAVVHSSAVAPAASMAAETHLAIDKKPIAQVKPARPRAERERIVQYTVDQSKFTFADRYPAPVIPDAKMRAASVTQISSLPEYGRPSLFQITGLLYLSIAGALLLRLLYGLLVAAQVRRSAGPVMLDASPLTDGLQLRVSDAVSSPVTIGSTVVLPADYEDWDSEKLRIVLAHERSHVRQGDFYLQLLSAIYAAAFWPSPLGWWLKRKLSDLAEAISDRAGLEEAADRTSYAQILLEFAAAPRPTLIGVAMARSGSVSRRIERLLNDVSFRQAFAGTRSALLVVLVVPVALFAATALVRVQAAGQQAPEPPVPAVVPTGGVNTPLAPVAPAAPQSGVSQPEEILGEPAPVSPALAPAPPAQIGAPSGVVAPAAPASPSVLTITPLAPTAAPSVLTVGPLSPARRELMITALKNLELTKHSLIKVAPVAPTMAIIAPRAGYGEGRGYGVGQSTATESGSSSYSNNGKHSGYHYAYSTNGESYAVIRGDGKDHMTFSGDWMEGRREEIEKARKQAHGDFLWFTRDDKAYFVDDPAILNQIEAMYKPMEALGAQQEVLGKQQEALGKQQEELGRQQEAVSVPTPDMSKELGQLNEAMAKLKASEGKNMTQDQFAELQEKIGELQGKLGEIQGQIGAKQGEFGEKMGKLGAMQGELGAQQGRLGAEQGRIAQEADRKVKSIIDESLKDGKAHQVQ
jgi:hypothetical protein